MNNSTLAITPNTDIFLLKTPFEMDEENTLTFTNTTAQYNYFNSLPKLELEGATYQRQDGVLRWAGSYDDIISYNYCMYRNTGFSNKWFYAFVEDIKFINPNMTEIKLKTDCYQTWAFDITYNKMFVEREHVNDDTVGKHTVPENLDTGDYIIGSLEYDQYNISAMNDNTKVCYILASTLDLDNPPSGSTTPYSMSFGSCYGGVYSGLVYWGSRTLYGNGIMNKLLDLSYRGQANEVVNLFVAPMWVVGVLNGEGDNPMSGTVYISTAPKEVTINITKPTTLGNAKLGTYTPKNKKLLTSKYNYLLVNNGGGGTAKFEYENWTGNNAVFKMIGTLTAGCSIKLVPSDYQYSGLSDVNSLVLGKYPTLSWTTDMYLNWLTQNAVNNTIDTVTAGVKGLFAPQGSSLLPLAEHQLNRLKEDTEHRFSPAQNNGNINSGDISYSYGFNRFQFYKMTIRKEYAQIIDDYLSAFGYRVNEYKTPNITGRTYWNYVKTNGCNITGDIPQKDIQELKRLFDRGITFWHDATKFLDYSQNNTIVT